MVSGMMVVCSEGNVLVGLVSFDELYFLSTSADGLL